MFSLSGLTAGLEFMGSLVVCGYRVCKALVTQQGPQNAAMPGRPSLAMAFAI